MTFDINTLAEAASFLATHTKTGWTEKDVLNAVIQSGWINGNADGITLLATVPDWSFPGCDAELVMTPPEEIAGKNSDGVRAVSDGLVLLPDFMMRDLLAHGRVSLLQVPGTHPNSTSAFVDISHLRISKAELERLLALANAECTTHSTDMNCPDIPGRLPRVEIGQLAVKVAFEIENETTVRAVAKEVIKRLQELCESGNEPALVKKIPNGVVWVTKKGVDRTYDIGACEKTLGTWNRSRA